MNLAGIDLQQFLIKLKGLIKKISRSQPLQIKSHTQKCHSIITTVIPGQGLFEDLNSQQVRLLAYESILFLIEVIKANHDKQTCENVSKNKIEKFLCQIYETLTAIKRLMKEIDANTNGNKFAKLGGNAKLSNGNDFEKNLPIYEERIGDIMSHFESENQLKRQPQQIISHKKLPDSENDFLIEEMHRIIQKKEQRISQLTHSLQQLNDEKNELQLSLNQTLNQYIHDNQSLAKRIQEADNENKQLLESKVDEKQRILAEQRLQVQRGLGIKKNMDQKIIGNESIQISQLHNRISTFTQCSFPSVKPSNQKHLPPRKFSLEQVGSSKSFRKICSMDEKDTSLIDKKYSELMQKNQQVYRLLFCQASTIEELI